MLRAGVVGFVAALLTAHGLAAQESMLQGIVRARNGLPLEDVAVTLEGVGERRHEVYTDRNGFYRITGIAPGTYLLRVRRLGYRGDDRVVTLEAGERRTESLRLEESALTLDSIVVRPEQGAAVTELGRQLVTSAEVRAVPVPGGSGDLATYLQILPGVTTTGDRGGQLYVRGGTPAENLVLVDGIPIYRPFHILGFYSIVPEALVASTDVYLGGFGARYNGRTSSVVDVRLRDGDGRGTRGMTSVSPFLAEAAVEGPGGPFRDGSWLVSARRSLIEETSEAVLGTQQPVTFESQLVRVASSAERDTQCSGLALRTRDRGRIDPTDAEAHVSWDNLAAGLRCSGIWPNGEMIEGLLAFSRSSSEAVTRGAARLRSSVWRLDHDSHTRATIRSIPVYAGFQTYIEAFDYDLEDLFEDEDQVEKDWILAVSAYAEGVVSAGDLEVRPGLVLVASPHLGVEPRLRARWEPFGRETEAVQGALGLYRQHVVGLSDMRDVSSVFTAWIKPDDPLTAMHARLGWQQTIGPGVHGSVEGYYNRMWDIPVPVWRALARFTTTLGRADGKAYGVDLRLDYRTPRFYGFLGYGYGRTVYESTQAGFARWFGEPVQSYHPPQDRRHQLNAVVSVDVAGFTASARWQLGTGLPFTRPIGFDETFLFPTGLHDVRTNLGSTRLILERPFTGRLPAMHRLDASVERPFDLSFGELVAQVGLINAYDRRNLFYYDIYTASRLDQLSVAPYLSLTLKGR